MSASVRTVLNTIYKSNCIVQIRSVSNMQVTASKLFYNDYGDPVKVIKKESEDILFENKNDQVLVKMLAAPVNPADINTIQGKYPVKPALPSIPGNEGVAEIVAVGSEVKNLSTGDRVIPLANALGTWRTHAVLDAKLLFKVPKQLGLAEAAQLTVNPCTAYRMLKDFATLSPGCTIIQNGGNSAVGQNVIQISKVWGINTVNIIRDRPNVDQLKSELKELGATEVLTEEELRTTDIFKEKYPKPCLALNCVGGKSATELMRHLAPRGTLVTYGGMSLQPVTVSTAALIFKDINVRGFWMTEWTKNNAHSEKRIEMLDDLIKMMSEKKIHSPVFEMVPFEKYEEALGNTLTSKGMTGKKFILNFEESSK